MSGTKDPGNPFVEWLLEELDERGMTREELARRADVDSAAITQVINRSKNLGVDLAKKIAKGLGVKQRIVLVVAGLIDDEDINDAKETYEVEAIQKELAQIRDPRERARIRRIVRTVVRAAAKSGSEEDETAGT